MAQYKRKPFRSRSEIGKEIAARLKRERDGVKELNTLLKMFDVYERVRRLTDRERIKHFDTNDFAWHKDRFHLYCDCDHHRLVFHKTLYFRTFDQLYEAIHQRIREAQEQNEDS